MLRTMFADGTTRSAERGNDNFTDTHTGGLNLEAFFDGDLPIQTKSCESQKMAQIHDPRGDHRSSDF